jgi:solute carrier family 35 protein
LLYLGNAITGLGGTKALSLPMFTALRRVTIVITMAFECYLLDVRASRGIQISVYIMIIGAFIAAVNDFTVSLNGYILVMLNNLFTATKGVIIKKKLDTTEFGPFGLMYYNALFMIFPAILIAFVTGDIEKTLNFPSYGDFYFWINMVLSCTLGFVLVWTMVECTNYNSSLTTSVVGAIKNIAISYAGMFIGGDYVFELYSFIGINISIAGSILYTYVISRTSG